MLRDLINNTGTSVWSVVSLIAMFVAFVAVLYWTFSGKKDRFEAENRLPLDDDEPTATHTQSTRG
ncbi:MAG: cbb3-type cytochrome c oxidase subunit 3 [bacterium]|nr:cbb3-type cytochrome c oxidase subunit 3 [bacterium]